MMSTAIVIPISQMGQKVTERLSQEVHIGMCPGFATPGSALLPTMLFQLLPSIRYQVTTQLLTLQYTFLQISETPFYLSLLRQHNS